MFTPVHWARWVVERFALAEKWLDGCTIMDPTAGEGSFLLALMLVAFENGIAPSKLPLERLYGVEREPQYISNFWQKPFRFKSRISVQNLYQADVLTGKQDLPKVDILVGNPPWGNYPDLPLNYKKSVKHPFEEYGLVEKTILYFWESPGSILQPWS